MANQESGLADYWDKIDALIAAASDPDNEPLRRVLEYGTPEQKREQLEEFDLSHDDLVYIHEELKKIVYQGSLKFWWW
jgi:hypothetical protein